MRRLIKEQEGQGGWRSRPRPSSLEHIPAWGIPFIKMMKAPRLEAELRSCLVLIWGLGGNRYFHFAVVGFGTVRSELRDKSRSQGKVVKPSRAGWSSRLLDLYHVQVGRRRPSGGRKKPGKQRGKHERSMNDDNPISEGPCQDTFNDNRGQ